MASHRRKHRLEAFLDELKELGRGLTILFYFRQFGGGSAPCSREYIVHDSACVTLGSPTACPRHIPKL